MLSMIGETVCVRKRVKVKSVASAVPLDARSSPFY